MSAAPLVSLRDVSVRYGPATPRVLGHVTLDLMAGDRLAVIGESGSGKSTLALALAGLLPKGAAAEGRIAWPGLGEKPLPGRDIGIVYQDPSGSLDPVMRIGDQVAEVVAAHAAGPTDRSPREQAVELLARVELPDPANLARSYPHQLSGGQRQRVALALALAGRPRVLVADEATSALDPVVQSRLVGLIGRLCDEEGLALVFVTHDIALAASLASRLAVVYAGRLVEIGPRGRVLAHPRHPYTRALMAAHLGLDRPPGGRLATVEGSPPDLASPPPGCRFAPRCSLAVAGCTSGDPPWYGEPDDGAACVFAERLAP
ncbi:ABC transporter ATP-binding protein [uncultured Alsobacter sp.]|uniref:ABC transporter ATP-binding protein n=1 Tax=uncultured Alsobacter sp. TaxID=1748258 RepID=UPI0025D5B67E|nr:ABC transporter ATP-binding protein [uncultured Alsobacter sp.]